MELVGITFTQSYMPLSEKLLLGQLCVALLGAFHVSGVCGSANLLSSCTPSCVQMPHDQRSMFHVLQEFFQNEVTFFMLRPWESACFSTS